MYYGQIIELLYLFFIYDNRFFTLIKCASQMKKAIEVNMLHFAFVLEQRCLFFQDGLEAAEYKDLRDTKEVLQMLHDARTLDAYAKVNISP